MACFSFKKKKLAFNGDIFILIPGLRKPTKNNLFIGLTDHVSNHTIENLCSSRRILALTIENASNGNKTKKVKSLSSYFGFPDPKILYAKAEDYLSIILGLIGEDCKVIDAVDFAWMNTEDKNQKESELGNTYYEVVSVLQILSISLFLKANETILNSFKPNSKSNIEKITLDEVIKTLILNFQLLDITIQKMFSKIDTQTLNSFPLDVNKNTFMSFKHQAKGYALEMELIKYVMDEDEDLKYNLVLKKNLSCEMFYCWKNALSLMNERRCGNDWGEKHLSFINWKLKSSQCIAYFFYGLFLDNNEINEKDGKDEKKDKDESGNCHGNAVACLNRSKNLLTLIQDNLKEFENQTPSSRPPIQWNAFEFLKESIPKVALRIERVNAQVYRNEKIPETAPDLPQVESFAFQEASWNFPPLHPDWS